MGALLTRLRVTSTLTNTSGTQQVWILTYPLAQSLPSLPHRCMHTGTYTLGRHPVTRSLTQTNASMAGPTYLRSWPHSQSTKLLMCCSAGSAGPLAAPLLLGALLLLLATCVNAPPLLGRDSITATSSLHALSWIRRHAVADSTFCTYA